MRGSTESSEHHLQEGLRPRGDGAVANQCDREEDGWGARHHGVPQHARDAILQERTHFTQACQILASNGAPPPPPPAFWHRIGEQRRAIQGETREKLDRSFAVSLHGVSDSGRAAPAFMS